MFDYGNAGIASITDVRLSGAPGLGVSLLRVEVDVMMQPETPPEPPARIIQIGGRLQKIAALASQYVDWRCVKHAQAQQVLLLAYLLPSQVRAIDEGRDAKGNFDVAVMFEALVERTGLLVRPSTAPYSVRVTNSDWLRVLTEMQFEDRVTFEVPVGRGRVGPPLDKAAEHMRAALDQVQHRHWDDAFTKCRETLDELQNFQPVPTPPWAEWSEDSKRRAWDISQRVVAAQAAIRHLMHAGPHSKIGNADAHAVRLAVAMTGALLRYYASL